MTEQQARRQLDKRAHGRKVRLGRVRAAAQRSETLDKKLGLQRRARELEQGLRLLHENYWREVGRLEKAKATRRRTATVRLEAPSERAPAAER